MVEPSGKTAARLAKEAPARKAVRRKVEGPLAGVAGSHPVEVAELNAHCLRAWVFGEEAVIGPGPGTRIGGIFLRERNAGYGPQFRGLVDRARCNFFGSRHWAKSINPPPGRHRHTVANFSREISWRGSGALGGEAGSMVIGGALAWRWPSPDPLPGAHKKPRQRWCVSGA